MKESLRHKRIWKILHTLVTPVFKRIFNYSCETYNPETPTLIISNHVTNFDPFLVATSFPTHQMYFVASEHLFRKGLLTKIIRYLVAPISRRKGSNGADTAMAMLRKLRAGHSVCIFGEGETSWNGIGTSIFPGTGDIARIGKVNLMTYRLEGGYFSAPRWGKGIRRGKMYGHVINIYAPEQLSRMSSEELNNAINQDISENAWERQKQNPQQYKGRKTAEQIETALFVCPKCHKIGSVYGKKNQVLCSCGFQTTYTDFGTFAPEQPFENILQWDLWQHEYLQQIDNPSFSDDNIQLVQILPDHSETTIAKGVLQLAEHSLSIQQQVFPLKSISHLALVQKHIMVFSCEGNYYELHAANPLCFRKYLAVWHNQNTKGA